MRILPIKKIVFSAALGTMLFSSGCTKDFGELNTDPAVVINPDVKFLLTYAENAIGTAPGGEWVWESMEQIFRFTQHYTSSPYELTNNANSRYGSYYNNILPNLFEVRRQIDLKADKESYAKIASVSYILQALYGLRVTDMEGSIPYTEAIKGRYDGFYNPVFDTQETLFTTWLGELDNAIATLSAADNAETKTLGNSDLFYKGDWTKWVRLANTLKLRIAARYENQDATKTASIAQSVMSDATGPILDVADNLIYVNPDYEPIGGAINYRDIKFATIPMVDFMKKVDDPRIKIYYNPNDLVGDFKQVLAANGKTLPSWIDINDPYIQYQGGPVDWTTNAPQQNYFQNGFIVNDQLKYNLISTINRKFWAPRQDGGTDGTFTELHAGAGETNLLIAEFIQKGYINGDVEQYYNDGIEASIKTMNSIAVTAHSTTGYAGTGDAEIAAYQADPLIVLDGTNDLERIYVQQHINLMRQANEAFVFARRTGYPRFNSTYYPREVFGEPIPRRFWIDDPGEVNRANWSAAYSEQGFTPNVKVAATLSGERVWYDKPAPAFGQGQ